MDRGTTSEGRRWPGVLEAGASWNDFLGSCGFLRWASEAAAAGGGLTASLKIGMRCIWCNLNKRQTMRIRFRGPGRSRVAVGNHFHRRPRINHLGKQSGEDHRVAAGRRNRSRSVVVGRRGAPLASRDQELGSPPTEQARNARLGLSRQMMQGVAAVCWIFPGIAAH